MFYTIIYFPALSKNKDHGLKYEEFVEMQLQLLLWFEGVQRKWGHLEGYGGSDKLAPAGIKIRASFCGQDLHFSTLRVLSF